MDDIEEMDSESNRIQAVMLFIQRYFKEKKMLSEAMPALHQLLNKIQASSNVILAQAADNAIIAEEAMNARNTTQLVRDALAALVKTELNQAQREEEDREIVEAYTC